MNKSTIISLCGLDATGKTTIFNLLKKKFNNKNFAFIPRGANTFEQIITDYFPRKYQNKIDWIKGDFASAISFACAVDFYKYYLEYIKPLENQRKIIITDRYSTCFLAYSMCIIGNNNHTNKLLKKVRPPDYVIFLTCQEKILKRRLEKRSLEQRHDFDNRNSQKRFMKSYLKLFKNYPSRVIKIRNNLDISVALNRIIEIINSII